MPTRIANTEDPNQTASRSALLAMPFWEVTSVRKFRTYSVNKVEKSQQAQYVKTTPTKVGATS